MKLMKTLNSKDKNFDKILDDYLLKRKNKIKSNLKSVTNIVRDVKKNRDNLIELIRLSRFSIPHPSSVPLGIYSKQAMISLGVWPLIQEKLVFTSSAQSNLKFISQGEVNIGISYLSDALLSPKVKILSKIKYEQPTYWAAKINKNSKNIGLNFINWLESRKAQNIIKNYGFESIYSEENY